MTINIAIQDLFGNGAIQDSDFLKIKKADLLELNATSDNRAEQLVVALILKACHLFKGLLIDENGNVIVSEGLDIIGYENSTSYDLSVTFWRTQLERNKIVHQFLVHFREKI